MKKYLKKQKKCCKDVARIAKKCIFATFLRAQVVKLVDTPL